MSQFGCSGCRCGPVLSTHSPLPLSACCSLPPVYPRSFSPLLCDPMLVVACSLSWQNSHFPNGIPVCWDVVSLVLPPAVTAHIHPTSPPGCCPTALLFPSLPSPPRPSSCLCNPHPQPCPLHLPHPALPPALLSLLGPLPPHCTLHPNKYVCSAALQPSPGLFPPDLLLLGAPLFTLGGRGSGGPSFSLHFLQHRDSPR